MTVAGIDGPDEECACDFVQIITVGSVRTEVHHVIPDDGAPHVEDVACPCRPDIDRIDTRLVVVDHRDQDPGPSGTS